MAFASPILVENLEDALSSGQFDAVLLVSAAANNEMPQLAGCIARCAQADQRIGREAVLLVDEDLPGQRLIYSPTGPLDRDYDDVRRFYDAAAAAGKLALQAGATRPLLVVEGIPDLDSYAHAAECAWLGVQQALWQPLEAREALGESEIEPIEQLGLYAGGASLNGQMLSALESGRRAARDLCGTDPERMAPPRFAEYCETLFEDTEISVSIIDDPAVLAQEYPLLHAVGRASLRVARHSPCVIRLEYLPAGEIERTLLLAGKGLTYDTGGADLKVGGAMAGMSRDKGGGAAVAGFLRTVADSKPRGLRVVAEIGVVRNSIGADAFVADEIITGHCGTRVRIGNTDAEGRLVLADLLSHLREDAQEATAPELFSIATLTGHAARAVGGYSALVENGVARSRGSATALALAGDLWADPAEISRSRREDFEFVKPRSKADDVLSCNNAPSSVTARGHQFPMAFLCIASGLDQHGRDSEQPLPYTHIDIAGSGVEGDDWQHGKPTASPLLMLSGSYL